MNAFLGLIGMKTDHVDGYSGDPDDQDCLQLEGWTGAPILAPGYPQ